eukprot:302418-Chlamydomonas_euryale.AAC.2
MPTKPPPRVPAPLSPHPAAVNSRAPGTPRRQVLFGLHSSESAIAEFSCVLATGADAAAALATAAPVAPGQAGFETAAAAAAGGLSPHRMGAPPPGQAGAASGGARAAVPGRLFVTQCCVCYTTMLDGDIKVITAFTT